MKVFESFLSGQMEAFIAYRKGLGYGTRHIRCMLLALDRYICRQPDPSVVWQPVFYLKLRDELCLTPSSVNGVLNAARCFFAYLKRQNGHTANPLDQVPGLPQQAFIPFVFTPQQIEQLLKAVSGQIRKTKRYFLRDFSDYLAILLLARCGMRINEPLRLKIADYRAQERTVYIARTKFKKDRLIPIPTAVAEQIDNYLAVRAAFEPSRDGSYLFIGRGQHKINDQRIRRAFHKALGQISVGRPRQVIGNTVFGKPTPHSLRHSFAVNTLKDAVARGQVARAVLPVLATYMGHVEYRNTVKYLKVVDAESGERLLNFAGSRREEA